MALQYQNISLPIATGIDESSDDRAAPAARLASLLNGVITKRGAIEQRHGFTPIAEPAGSPTMSGIRGIASSGNELLAVTGRRMWAYVPGHDEFIERGNIGPCTGHTRTLFRDQYDWQYCDLDSDAGTDYALVAGHSQNLWDNIGGAPVDRSSIAVYTLPDWQCIHEPESMAVQLHRPKVFHTNLALHAIGCPTGANNVYRYDFPIATPSTAPVYGGIIVNDCEANPAHRTYDACYGKSGGYYFCYIHVGGAQLHVQHYSSTHVLLAEGALTFAPEEGEFITLACCWSSSGSHLYVLYVIDDGPYQHKVRLTRFGEDTCAAVWTRELHVLNLGSGELGSWDYVHTLGVVVHDGRPTCVWTARMLPGSWPDLANPPYPAQVGRHETTWSASVAADNSGVSAVRALQNTVLLTRPFVTGSRCYIDTESDLKANDEALFCYQYVTNCMYELRALGDGEGGVDGGAQRYFPAGVHDVGTASVVRHLLYRQGEGAANNVVNSTFAIGTLKYAYANHSRSTSSLNKSYVQNNPYGLNKRALDAVELDFYTRPQLAKVHQDMVYCSGSYGTWYDSVDCLECHTPVPPIVDTKIESSTAYGELTPDDYIYIAIWESRDHNGTVHRSVTSPAYHETLPVGSDTIGLTCRSVGFTDRWYDDSILTAALYRADTEGVYRRCNPHAIAHNNDQNCVIGVCDAGEATGENLYTTGGALENVCPEGFRWCMVHNERVWTGGHYRRARVQYSKRFTPGTATELEFAPEFHEGMGFVLPGDDECTGLGALDDKVIIFSDRKIYAVAGAGPNDAGLGSDFSQLTLITDKVGCSDGHTVASFPGGVMFANGNELHILTRSLEVVQVGERIRDILDTYADIRCATTVPDEYQVRVICYDVKTAACIMVYDYRLDEWFQWNPLSAAGAGLSLVSSCVHDGEYYVATSTRVLKYNKDVYLDDTTRYVPLYFALQWIQPGGLLAWQRVRDVIVNAEYLDKHEVTVTLFHDFSGTHSQEAVWDATELQALPEYALAKREQLKLRSVRQKCQALRLTFEAANDGSTTGMSCRVFSVGLRVGMTPQQVRVAAAQQA